jgi:hypothetical protein
VRTFIGLKNYFLSSPRGGGAGVTVGGFAGGAGGGGVCVLACMPSLKLRMPSPSPRITSGIFFPPNRRTMIAKTINQWIGLNSPMFTCLPECAGLTKGALRARVSTQSITRSSPTRRVKCSRSRYSSSGIAYFRDTPVSSLNAPIGSLGPRSLRYLASASRNCVTAI